MPSGSSPPLPARRVYGNTLSKRMGISARFNGANARQLDTVVRNGAGDRSQWYSRRCTNRRRRPAAAAGTEVSRAYGRTLTTASDWRNANASSSSTCRSEEHDRRSCPASQVPRLPTSIRHARSSDDVAAPGGARRHVRRHGHHLRHVVPRNLVTQQNCADGVSRHGSRGRWSRTQQDTLDPRVQIVITWRWGGSTEENSTGAHLSGAVQFGILSVLPQRPKAAIVADASEVMRPPAVRLKNT